MRLVGVAPPKTVLWPRALMTGLTPISSQMLVIVADCIGCSFRCASLGLAPRYHAWMLQNLSLPPRQPSDRKPPLLVLLHGYGSNEADLFALAPELDPRFQLVSLRAPIPLGGPAFAWFRLDFTPDGLRADEDQARKSAAQLAEEVDDL